MDGKDGGSKKLENIHRKQLFGGRHTAEEVHQKLGLGGKKCFRCYEPAAILIRVLAQLSELTQRQPEFVAEIAATNPNGPYVPTVPTTYGPLVLLSSVAACRLCRKQAEYEAAHAPSWVIVEIQRGPGADSPIVQVPSLIA